MTDEDKFFGVERKTEPGVWDGVPKIALTYDQVMSLYSLCPSWHGCAIGPLIPFSHGERARLTIDAIFQPDLEGAVGAMQHNIRAACAREHMPYEEDEWTITHLVMQNGC